MAAACPNQIPTQFSPKRRDVDVDGVRHQLRVVVVEMLGDAGPRDDFAATLHQELEDAVLPRGQLDFRAVAVHAARRHVDPDLADDQVRRRMAGGAPAERTQPGDELGNGKWLGQIVVGAQIQSVDAVVEVKLCKPEELSCQRRVGDLQTLSDTAMSGSPVRP